MDRIYTTSQFAELDTQHLSNHELTSTCGYYFISATIFDVKANWVRYIIRCILCITCYFARCDLWILNREKG